MVRGTVLRSMAIAGVIVGGVTAIPQLASATNSSTPSISSLFGSGCKVETIASSPNMTGYLSSCAPEFRAAPHGVTYSQQSAGGGTSAATTEAPADGVPGAACSAITDGNECIGYSSDGTNFVGSFTNHTSGTVYGGNGLYQGLCIGNSNPVGEPATSIPPGYTYTIVAGPAYSGRPITSKFFSNGVYFGAVCATFTAV